MDVHAVPVERLVVLYCIILWSILLSCILIRYIFTWHDIKIDVMLAELKLRTLDQNSQGWAVCFAISCRKQKILTALHEHMLLSNVEKHFLMNEDQS